MDNFGYNFDPSELTLDILDEEFNHFIALARGLMSTIQNPHERNICVKYIRKCSALQCPIVSVKLNRNAFFRYFLKILKKASGSTMVKFFILFRVC